MLKIIEINGQASSLNTSNGTAALMANGKISYISNDITTNIIDQVTVTVSDNQATSIVRIAININSVNSTGNNPPAAKAEPFVAPAILELTPYIYNANGFAEDADGDNLRISAVKRSKPAQSRLPTEPQWSTVMER